MGSGYIPGPGAVAGSGVVAGGAMLPVTGTSVTTLVITGLAMIGLGTVAILANVRRRRREASSVA